MTASSSFFHNFAWYVLLGSAIFFTSETKATSYVLAWQQFGEKNFVDFVTNLSERYVNTYYMSTSYIHTYIYVAIYVNAESLTEISSYSVLVAG